MGKEMKQTKLALPGNSYEVVAKILHAYALCGDKPVSLDEVAAKAGMAKSQVSKNNGFLVSIGLLTEGKSKTLTPEGKTLAIALGHDLEEDAAAAWRRALTESPATRSVLEMIRVQKAIPKDALPGKIAASLGEPDSQSTTTGTNSLIEVFQKAGLLKETDGKYSITPGVLEAGPDEGLIQGKEQTGLGGVSPTIPSPSISPQPSQPENAGKLTGTGDTKLPIPIHVNIELHLPASSEQAVYDALFKSIRENLLS